MVIGIIANVAGLIPFMRTQHSVSLDYDSHKEISSSHEATGLTQEHNYGIPFFAAFIALDIMER